MSNNELPEEFKLPPKEKKGLPDFFYVWMILVLLFSFYVFVCAGCSTASPTPQPKFIPEMYVPVNGGCMFENAADPTDTLMGGDDKMGKMYLTPIDEIARLQAILNRCQEWK